MTDKNKDVLDHALGESDAWISEVAQGLSGSVPGTAHSALRAALHALRDCLSFEDALKLANGLPLLIRGLYYEGWNPNQGGEGEATRESFLECVADGLTGVGGVEPEAAAFAVLQVLKNHDSQFARGWPEPIRNFRPEGEPAEEGTSAEGTAGEIQSAIDRARDEGASEEDLPTFIDRPRAPGKERRTKAGSVFAKPVQKANVWLKELMEYGGYGDRRLAYLALRGVLQALRDRLNRDEAFQLGAQLPSVVRGMYFEEWNPEVQANEERTLEKFLMGVSERLAGEAEVAPDEAATAVFRLLSSCVSEGELSDVRGRLPGPIRDLWPEEWVESLGLSSGAKLAAESPQRGRRASVRRARKEIRSIMSRARARGVRERDLPVFVSRRKLRSKRGSSQSSSPSDREGL